PAGLPALGPRRPVAAGAVRQLAGPGDGRAVRLELAGPVGQRPGGVQRGAAAAVPGAAVLGRLRAVGRVLGPDPPELAVGDAGDGLDGGVLRVPAAARLAG